MKAYSKLTGDKFQELLQDVIDDNGTSGLLLIPGIYEILSEYYNNEVLDRYDYERQKARDIKRAGSPAGRCA